MNDKIDPWTAEEQAIIDAPHLERCAAVKRHREACKKRDIAHLQQIDRAVRQQGKSDADA
jgi:urease accessory protein UreF